MSRWQGAGSMICPEGEASAPSLVGPCAGALPLGKGPAIWNAAKVTIKNPLVREGELLFVVGLSDSVWVDYKWKTATAFSFSFEELIQVLVLPRTKFHDLTLPLPTLLRHRLRRIGPGPIGRGV